VIYDGLVKNRTQLWTKQSTSVQAVVDPDTKQVLEEAKINECMRSIATEKDVDDFINFFRQQNSVSPQDNTTPCIFFYPDGQTPTYLDADSDTVEFKCWVELKKVLQSAKTGKSNKDGQYLIVPEWKFTNITDFRTKNQGHVVGIRNSKKQHTQLSVRQYWKLLSLKMNKPYKQGDDPMKKFKTFHKVTNADGEVEYKLCPMAKTFDWALRVAMMPIAKTGSKKKVTKQDIEKKKRQLELLKMEQFVKTEERKLGSKSKQHPTDEDEISSSSSDEEEEEKDEEVQEEEKPSDLPAAVVDALQPVDEEEDPTNVVESHVTMECA
jgi:hypothetical protein